MAKRKLGEPREVRTMRIGAPRIECRNGRARLIAEIRIGEGDVRPLWFEVEEKYGQYLCAERSDAFLIGLLNFAQREWLDIVCEAPVSAQLLYQIRTYLIPSLARNSKAMHETRIEAPMDDAPMANAGGVGTGISCGVDSLHVVKNYAHSPYPGLSLTHLCLNNVGAYIEGKGQYTWQAEHARQFAKEMGIENHLLTHTYSSCFAIYAMQKLWKVYFYASAGYDLQEAFSLRDNERHSSDHYELLSLDCFSTRTLQIYSEGMAITRFEKERELADWPPAQKYLHVCTMDTGPNCGHCSKCLRTLTALDALGCLQRKTKSPLGKNSTPSPAKATSASPKSSGSAVASTPFSNGLGAGSVSEGDTDERLHSADVPRGLPMLWGADGAPARPRQNVCGDRGGRRAGRAGGGLRPCQP